MSLLERLLSFRKRIDQNHSMNCTEILDASDGEHSILLNQSSISARSLSNSTEMLLLQLQSDRTVHNVRKSIQKMNLTIEKLLQYTFKQTFAKIRKFQHHKQLTHFNNSLNNQNIPANAFSKKKSIMINISQPINYSKISLPKNQFNKQQQLPSISFSNENMPAQCSKKQYFCLNPSIEDINDNAYIFFNENLQQSNLIASKEKQQLKIVNDHPTSEFSIINLRERINDIKTKHHVKQRRNISIKQILSTSNNKIKASKSSSIIYHRNNTNKKSSLNGSFAQEDSLYKTFSKCRRQNKENLLPRAWSNSIQSFLSSIEKDLSLEGTKSRTSITLKKNKKAINNKNWIKQSENKQHLRFNAIKSNEKKRSVYQVETIEKNPIKLTLNLAERNWKQLYEEQKKSFLKTNAVNGGLSLKKQLKQQGRKTLTNKKLSKTNFLRQIVLDLNL